MKEKNLEQIRRDRDRSSRIRLVATDMDGTFLNEKSRISRRNIRAVKRLMEEGIEFVVCTGRRIEDVTPFLDEMQVRCGVVSMNGAALYDKEGIARKKVVLSKEQVNSIIKSLDNWNERLVIQLVSEKNLCVLAREEILEKFVIHYIMPGPDRQKERDELMKSYVRMTGKELLESTVPFYKIEIMSEDTELIQEIRGVIDQVDGICIGASFATNWEITHKDASKGAGLKAYGETKGYELSQIMALGDGGNDETMLSLPLGWSVAMENGTDKIKEAAQVITGSNEKDGFAQAVEALLESRRLG